MVPRLFASLSQSIPGKARRAGCEQDQSVCQRDLPEAVAEKSIGAASLDLIAAVGALGTDNHSRRRSSELRQ
jgi:hypothetical protein